MQRKLTATAIVLMWVLALALGIAAARYFLNPIPLLFEGLALALGRHPEWVLVHIACGITALVAGPFQFVTSLRASRPKVHRATGYIYLTAVMLGGVTALRLSSDTAQFAADGLNDHAAFELFAVSPTVFGIVPNTTYVPSQFPLVPPAFASLGIVWIVTSAAALVRARQRKFTEHRAWMIRSYSLTFGAVTTRVIGPPLLFVTQDPVLAITLTFWSWIVNLLVAEWLVRSKKPQAFRTIAELA